MDAPSDCPEGCRAAALRQSKWHWIALGLIIVCGGAIRFYRLSHPALWGDEAATWSRVVGSLRDLLDVLQTDGFAPLHYLLYWLIGRFTPLTPTVMRLSPAVCGTLMIGAMYLLGRQLLRPGGALLAAALTSGSAWMIAYSRDAKMYAETWLFVALFAAAFFHWMRRGGATSWLAWIAAGLAAVGFHAGAWLVMALAPLWLLSRPTARWRQVLLLVMGMAIIGAGSGGYYLGFNRWLDRTGGLAPGATDDNSPPPPGEVENNWNSSGLTWIGPRIGDRGGWELLNESLSAYLLGYHRAEEMRSIYGTLDIPNFFLRWRPTLLAGLYITFGIGIFPWRAAGRRPAWRRGEISAPPAPECWWQVLLWLGMWLALPTYGFFYCRSVPDFASPTQLLRDLRQLTGGWGALLALEAALIAAAMTLWPPLARVIGVALPVALFGLLAGALIPHPSAALRWLAFWTASPWFWFIAAPPAAAGCFYYSSDTTRRRLARAARLLMVALIVWGLCWIAWRLWDGLWRAAQTHRPPIKWQPLWMPRYLGIIWPAVMLAASALLLRLPTRPLRYAAIGLLLAANLGQGLFRVLGPTEPPVDRIAADISAFKDDESSAVYVQRVYTGGSPGTGGLFSLAGKYYLWLQQRPPMGVKDARERSIESLFHLQTLLNWDALSRVLKNKPQVRRLIVWDFLRPPAAGAAALADDGWQKISQTIVPVRLFWNWQLLGEYRRSEWRR